MSFTRFLFESGTPCGNTRAVRAAQQQPTGRSGSHAARSGLPRTGSVGTEFRKVVGGFGGRLLLIDGPGAVLGIDATSTSLGLEAP